jgi:uridine kinase
VNEIPHPKTNGSGLPFIGALVNNNVSSLSFPLSVNSEVRFLTMADPHGWRLYRNSLCFLLAKTVNEVFPQATFSIEHSFGPGLYCSFHKDTGSREGICRKQLATIETRMRELVRRDIPIERRKISYMDAVRQFERAGQKDKFNILKYRNPPNVVIHWCDGFSDVAHGPLVPSTGVLTRFKLIHYKPGFILHLPERENAVAMPPFEDQPHLFQIFQEHKEWGRILDVSTVGRLNEIIAAGEIENFILTAEALHEKKLARIADRIAAARNRIKLILISGPSSAGKTSFAKRLTVHLTVNGLRPITIGTDDYFVDPAHTPRDEEGNFDYEHIEAVNLKLFNRHLLALVQGKAIEPPHFNFEKKRVEFSGNKLHLEDDQMLIVEGIHALNPRLTQRVPARNKFRIYVSALTQLNVDSNNRISTTDNRLMRRMVRDRKYRGHSALETLRLWPSVRRGEKRWIFPFQREADVAFNSALDYELAVLKPLVEPLLMEVKPSHMEYAESRRLSEFLLNFLGTSDHPVPRMSILREYIGGSVFRY